METEVKKHPDFPQWIQGEEGKGCMRWPISEPTYLKNRLFWAFDAGRNCVWEQYMNQKSELASLREQLKQKEEVIRELIPIAEERLRRIVNYDMPDYYKVRSEIQDIIKRAKLLSKQPQ